MSKPLLNGIIREVTGKDNQYLSISRSDIIKIAERYAVQLSKSQAQLEKTQRENSHKRIISHRIKIAYSKGVKHGYMLHADEQYEKAMFEMWKKHVAGPTEANACFNEHARLNNEYAEMEDLEIVEPEVIVTSSGSAY
jgi:hypothetical protein